MYNFYDHLKLMLVIFCQEVTELHFFFSVTVAQKMQFYKDVLNWKSTTQISPLILVSGHWDFVEKLMTRIIQSVFV